MTKTIDTKQRQRIFGLLSATGLTHDRKDLMTGFSDAESMNDMKYKEAGQMINWLQKEQNKQVDALAKKRRKVIHICYLLPEDFGFWYWNLDQKKFDGSILDEWLLNNPKSPFKKALNGMTGQELSKLITAFENMRKFYSR